MSGPLYAGRTWGERFGELFAEGLRESAPSVRRQTRRLVERLERERRFRTPVQIRLGRVGWRAWRLGDPGRPEGYTGGVYVGDRLLVSLSWWRR